MATKAISGYGATLTWNDPTVGLVGEIMSVSGSRTRNVIDILTCDSTNQAVEVISGALNEGEVSFSLIYDGASGGSYNDLNTDFIAGTSATATIAYSDTSSHAGTGIITNLSVPSLGGPDDAVTVDLTIRFSGQCTYTDVE